jgi:hypothetical protein
MIWLGRACPGSFLSRESSLPRSLFLPAILATLASGIVFATDPPGELANGASPKDERLDQAAVGPLVDVTDPDQLASLLKREELALSELYRSLPRDGRLDLIAALNSADLLRPQLEEMLSWEPQSEIRATLLDCMDPISFADLNAKAADPELVALLELPTPTPIGDLEWVARMELANAIDPSVGAKWVRPALEAFPSSPAVNFTGSVIVLLEGTSPGFYTTKEIETATSTLGLLLKTEASLYLSPSRRTRAYYALFNSPENLQVLEIYRTRLLVETDPRAREVLGTLQARLEIRMATLP